MSITSLKKIYSGKVRDLYEIDARTMLMVASDRLSAFDLVLKQEIPDKGKYLTQISLFWFNYLADIMPSHLTNLALADVLSGAELDYAGSRAIIVQRLTPLPIEIIVRGYLAGSGYQEYLATGAISGHKLAPNMQNAQQLEQAIFTPSTKAKLGEHDRNISIQECQQLIGHELTKQIETLALSLYNKASNYAKQLGIIIADTKFEFGLDEKGQLVLIDEVLTPDSSRFWDMAQYSVGSNPLSFDKQFVRDYLINTLQWNKQAPVPNLAEIVLKQTSAKYYEVLARLTNNCCTV